MRKAIFGAGSDKDKPKDQNKDQPQYQYRDQPQSQYNINAAASEKGFPKEFTQTPSEVHLHFYPETSSTFTPDPRRAHLDTKGPETKYVKREPDFRLNTNDPNLNTSGRYSVDADMPPSYHSAEDANPNVPNYRYYSDPATGLTAIINTAKFDVQVIDIRKLNLGADISIPEPTKFKVLPILLTPKDGSAPFFDVLVHTKSGTAKSDQECRDDEAELLAKVNAKLHEIFGTNVIRVQGDINISSYIPKDPKNISTEYLTNHKNYEVNKAGLKNAFTRMTPPGFMMTNLSTPTEIRCKGREENIIDNGQGTKLGHREGGAKAITIEYTFSPIEHPKLRPAAIKAAIEAQQQSFIDAIKVPTKFIGQFGVNVFDSDHARTDPQTDDNGFTFVTDPKINTVGPFGFKDEGKLILPHKNNARDRAERLRLKNEFTAQLFGIILDKLESAVYADGRTRKINMAEYTALQNPTLMDAGKFILANEWALMNQATLESIFSEVRQLKSIETLNEHYYPENAILGTRAKIDACLNKIFRKNYRITVVKSETLNDPEKNEFINVKKDKDFFHYKLKNHDGMVYSSSVRIPANFTNDQLSEDQEEVLKVSIIKDVNLKNSSKSRPVAVKGAHIVNNFSDVTGLQCCAGFPCHKENWKPREEQHTAIFNIVEQTGADFIGLTETSDQRNKSHDKIAEVEEAQARDETGYVEIFKSEMENLCSSLNQAYALKMGVSESSTLSHFSAGNQSRSARPQTRETSRFKFTPMGASERAAYDAGHHPLSATLSREPSPFTYPGFSQDQYATLPMASSSAPSPFAFTNFTGQQYAPVPVVRAFDQQPLPPGSYPAGYDSDCSDHDNNAPDRLDLGSLSRPRAVTPGLANYTAASHPPRLTTPQFSGNSSTRTDVTSSRAPRQYGGTGY